MPDVAKAQAYDRDHLGFDIAWHNTAGKIGAVSHGDCAILFREDPAPATPSVFWVFTQDVDAAHRALVALGANTFEPPENKSWGLRQFAIKDPFDNTFIFHHDL